MSENFGLPQAPISIDREAAEQSAPEGDNAFRAVLYPHRSLGPRGFLILMIAIGSVSFITGLAFLLAGAWPVFGFFGLDVALIYIAFRLNYRAARLYETIELTPHTLTITRVQPSGEQESFEFNPYWVRVLLKETPQGQTDLRIASHGREFAFGRFLTNDERLELCGALSGALADARDARA